MFNLKTMKNQGILFSIFLLLISGFSIETQIQKFNKRLRYFTQGYTNPNSKLYQINIKSEQLINLL